MKEEREMHTSTTHPYSKTLFKVYSDLRHNGKLPKPHMNEAQSYEKGGTFQRGEISKYYMSIGS